MVLEREATERILGRKTHVCRMCGVGAWLLDMEKQEYGNLYGGDPLFEKAHHYKNRVTIRSCSVHEMEGVNKKVIFVRFPRDRKSREFLYPPVYRDADTDYICFTDDKTVTSSEWKIRRIKSPMTADLESYLKKYEARWELKLDQVQMGSVWHGHLKENIVTVPALEELPGVNLDLEHFERTADEKGDYIYRKNPIYKDGKYNGRPLLLTIGVPVSNQIDTIERCLNSVKPLLDALDSELLVVDTGSTDGTLDVCRRYGARIVVHAWHDNMSAVRNEGIYNARGQWFMSIDDDEWFEDVEDILNFFQQGIYRRYQSAMYTQRNYIDSAGKTFDDTPAIRMAEITPELHFEGRIHDAMVMKGGRGAILSSYVHHYGFARDNLEKEKAKAERNLAILPYDIYEYPKDLRYLYQLGKECDVTMGCGLSVRILVQTIALAVSSGNAVNRNYGKYSAMEMFNKLYNSNDERLFSWSDHLQKSFPFSWVERAAVAWYQEELGITLKKPAREVVKCYEIYEKMLEKYRRDPVADRSTAMHGLSLVEREFYVMDARAAACWKYLDLGEENNAAKILRQMSLETIKNKRVILMEKGFSAGDEVFTALCAQITDMQWETWSSDILNIFVMSLKREDIRERQERRFSEILRRVSVDSVLAWVESHEGKYKGVIGERLIEYTLRLDTANAFPQELCVASWMLKEEYVNKRGTAEGDRLLRQYILATGAFAKRYYNEEQLTDRNSCAVSPDIRALYRMACAVSCQVTIREKVALLKQALEIFPSFHEEIRGILLELSAEAY